MAMNTILIDGLNFEGPRIIGKDDIPAVPAIALICTEAGEGMKIMSIIHVADRRKATDKRIYEAAIVEFGNKGYANTTLSAIAKSAGITPGLIVQNFGSKRDLYWKITTDIVKNIAKELDTYSHFWEERCRSVVTYIMKTLEEYPNAMSYMNFYVSLITSLDTPDDILQELYATLSEPWMTSKYCLTLSSSSISTA